MAIRLFPYPFPLNLHICQKYLVQLRGVKATGHKYRAWLWFFAFLNGSRPLATSARYMDVRIIDHMSILGPLSLTLTRRTTIQNIAEQGAVIKNGFLFIVQYTKSFQHIPFLKVKVPVTFKFYGRVNIKAKSSESVYPNWHIFKVATQKSLSRLMACLIQRRLHRYMLIHIPERKMTWRCTSSSERSYVFGECIFVGYEVWLVIMGLGALVLGTDDVP